MALHISPRLLVAFVARAHYVSQAQHVAIAHRPAYMNLVTAAFYLNLTELATLCGVTYISNKENYREFIYYICNITLAVRSLIRLNFTNEHLC